MAYSVVQSTGATQASGTSLTATFGSAVSTSNKIVVAVVCADNGGAATCTSVKDGALNSWTKLATVNNTQVSQANTELTLWGLDAPTATALAMTATISPSTSSSSMVIQEVSGLLAGNTSAMLDGTAGSNTGRNPTSPSSPTYSSTALNEYLVELFGDWGASVTFTKPTGMTLAGGSTNTSNNNDLAISYANSANGAESYTYTISAGDTWCQLLVAFKLAGGGSTFIAPRLLEVNQSIKRASFY